MADNFLEGIKILVVSAKEEILISHKKLYNISQCPTF